ncbi:nucleotidyltransferase family protein [Candidatus Bathyarchaeota archaeon]|nr:nucleotidyltransferase family protein [Candidatus Bathyarchaeota archaeon]
MIAVILAGGFAKRMWPLTKDKPKHLLPVAGKPMLTYVLEKIEPLDDVEQIIISTNAAFVTYFSEFLSKYKIKKKISLFVEDIYSEKEKLGSVGALGYLIRKNNIEDELLVIGGDNIFDFSLSKFLEFFRQKKANAIALFNIKSSEKAKLYGVVSIDSEFQIVDFQEKPDEPRSTLVSTACYVFTRDGVKCILRYLEKGNDPDKMGHFIEWLYKNEKVYGFIFSGIWFDIGSFESYHEANEYFLGKNRNQ